VRVTTAGPSLDDLLTCYTDALICSFLKRMTVCKARVGQKVAIAKKDHDVGEMTSVQMSRIRRWEIGLNDALNESEEKLMTIKDMFPHLDNYNLWVQCFKAIDPINQALEIMEQGLEESASRQESSISCTGKKRGRQACFTMNEWVCITQANTFMGKSCSTLIKNAR